MSYKWTQGYICRIDSTCSIPKVSGAEREKEKSTTQTPVQSSSGNIKMTKSVGRVGNIATTKRTGMVKRTKRSK